MSAKLNMAMMAIVILAFALKDVQAEYDVVKYCALVPKNTKLPSLESSKTYYNCVNSYEVTKIECLNNQVFNKDKGGCVDGDDPCEGVDQAFAKDFIDCRMWHWCVNGKSLGKGTCPSGQYFTGKECVIGKCENSNGAVTEVKNECNIMKVGMFFGDFDNCAVWKKCKSDGSLGNGKCNEEPQYVFNIELQACVPYKKEVCERTGGIITETGPQETCNSGVTKAHSITCSKYYKCENKKWELKQCKQNEYFDVDKKKCINRQNATPVETCNRCEYSSNKWVNAVDSKCTKFLTCKDGHKVNEGSCGENNYFNEQIQSCLLGTTNLKTYANTNGACKCDLECEIENCGDDNKCKTDLCKDDNSTKDECYCLNNKAELKCKIKECKGDNECEEKACKDQNEPECNCINNPEETECKLEACNTIPTTKEKVNCKLEACDEDSPNKVKECKNNACGDYKNVGEENDKAECKLKVCDLEETTEDKVNCKLEACDEGSPDNVENCKIDACDDYKEVGEENDKAKCKIDACGDNVCKNKVCVDSLQNTEACELIKCDIKQTTKEKVNCKLEACDEDGPDNVEECKNKACDDYDEISLKAECKFDLCNDNDPAFEDCKQAACDIDDTITKCEN